MADTLQRTAEKHAETIESLRTDHRASIATLTNQAEEAAAKHESEMQLQAAELHAAHELALEEVGLLTLLDVFF